MPQASAWPRREGAPLAFLAQIDLDALPLVSGLLPDSLLSFFYDVEEQPWGAPEDRGGWAVAWTLSTSASCGGRRLPTPSPPARSPSRRASPSRASRLCLHILASGVGTARADIA